MKSTELKQLKQNPRHNFVQAIREMDAACCLVKTAEIHGHYCPGSAMGVMASLCGLNLLSYSGQPATEATLSDGLESLMAIVEINACFADGVQAVSGCTLGNNALVYRDLGRHAVTFAIRGRETGVRVRVRPDFESHVRRASPEFYSLLEKVIKDRTGTPKDEEAFMEKAKEAAFALIELSFDELLITETVHPVLPAYAPITESVICPGCGEMIMATKTVTEGRGSGLCFMCAGTEYRQVEGQGIVACHGQKPTIANAE